MLRVIAKRVSKGPAIKQGLGRPRLYVIIFSSFGSLCMIYDLCMINICFIPRGARRTRRGALRSDTGRHFFVTGYECLIPCVLVCHLM